MPKTVRNVYIDCLSFEELLKAHKMARRGKREKREVIIFELPYNFGTRMLPIISKSVKTNSKYPRKFSEIKKKPL